MQGEVLINDWKVALEGDGFNPILGIGRVLIGFCWTTILFDLETCRWHFSTRTNSRKMHIRFEKDFGSNGARGPYLSPD
jgi:hypothetical protein